MGGGAPRRDRHYQQVDQVDDTPETAGQANSSGFYEALFRMKGTSDKVLIQECEGGTIHSQEIFFTGLR